MNDFNFSDAWAIVVKFTTEIYIGSSLGLIKRDGVCLQHIAFI